MTPLVVENEPPVTFLRRKMTGGRFSTGVVIRRYTGTSTDIGRIANDVAVLLLMLFMKYMYRDELPCTERSHNKEHLDM